MLESFAAKMPLKLKIKRLWTSLNPSEVFLLPRSEAIIKNLKSEKSLKKVFLLGFFALSFLNGSQTFKGFT